ncbi:MAG: stage IV sporulation protein A [Lachnospiraceae bacterium]|nr:stage IV sporulation protein A [Lachnospiraceae bacterium]
MAEEFNLYQDIAGRTGGSIYIGCVGPVRTGKSTFIKNFMEMMILPGITDPNERSRTIDEMPQSSNGRTIMTTEPKFIPNEGVEVAFADQGGEPVHFKAKMIDCVGYMVPGAIGHMEENESRMVKTPWFEEEIPFVQAAEIGTRKVIAEHSTVGLVITTDGTVTDIAREDYKMAEQRVVQELQKLGKPFIVLLNSANPDRETVRILAAQLSEEYGVRVMPINAKELKKQDIENILQALLEEFPAKQLSMYFPGWMETLDSGHSLKQAMITMLRGCAEKVSKMKDLPPVMEILRENPYIKKVRWDGMDLCGGTAQAEIELQDHLFYDVLSEMTNVDIGGEREMILTIRELAESKKEYEKLEAAYKEAMQRGYGIVSPMMESVELEEPKVIRQGGKFGVQLRATAPSVHFIRTEVVTEINPYVGTQEQCQDFLAYLNSQSGDIWETEIFGRSVQELVKEGFSGKLQKMPEMARAKLQQTLERVINEGRGNLICIVL